MKKLIFIFALLAFAVSGFGQATPSGQLRIADTSTLFVQNISVGTSLFVVADSSYWVAVAPVAGTFNLNKSYHKLVPSNTQKWVMIGATSGGGTPTDTTGFYSAFHIVQEFDESTTHTHGENHTLVGLALPNSVVVSLNGMELKKGTPPTYADGEYSLTFENGTLPTTVGVFHINLPVYQYDRIKILYAYTIPNQ